MLSVKLSLPDASSPKINLEKLQSKRNTDQRNEREQRDEKDLEKPKTGLSGARCQKPGPNHNSHNLWRKLSGVYCFPQ